MNSARAVNHLSILAAAYIAGLIDGEGTITLTRLHANENRRLVISIANTELALLEFVIDQVGAGKITRKRNSQPQHTPSFCHAVTSGQALSLLSQISPHLRSYKRKRADLALTLYEQLTPRNGKYDARTRADRLRFEQRLLSLNACR